MNKRVQSLIDGVNDALEMARSFASGKFLWAVFFCHLAVEKMLKAVVLNRTGEVAPKTHNLMHLLKLGQLSPPKEALDFLGQLNTFSVPTRYPDELPGIEEMFGRDCKEIQGGTREARRQACQNNTLWLALRG